MAKIGPKEAQRRALREAEPVIAREKLFLSKANIRSADAVAYVTTVTEPMPTRGRPPLKLTPSQRAERKRQQTLKRVRALRARKAKK